MTDAHSLNATLGNDAQIAGGSDAFVTNLIISISLVLVAGCMAGATMNLTGLDPLRLYLRVLAREGDEDFAKRAHSVTKDPHLLLVTLLLCNAAANEALPIFLGRIVDPMLAIIISVTCVLFFGEIIPSAICLNPSMQLRIAACSAPFVKVLIWLCYPLAWPIAKLLDRLLPHGGVDRLSLKELTYLVMLQSRRDRQRGVMISSTKAKISAKPLSAVAQMQPDLGPSAAAAKSSKTRYGTATVAAAVSHRACTVAKGNDVDADPAIASDGVFVTRAHHDLCGSGRGTHVQRRRRLRRQISKDFQVTGTSTTVAVNDGPMPSDDQWVALRNQGLHVADEPADVDDKTVLTPDQAAIIVRVLGLRDQTVAQCMTSSIAPQRMVDVGGGAAKTPILPQLCMLSYDDRLDLVTMGRILEWGMSRLPVYAGGDRNNIVGYVLVKRLIQLDPDDATPVSSLILRTPLAVTPDTDMFELLDAFQAGKSHIAVVTEQADQLSDRWAQRRVACHDHMAHDDESGQSDANFIDCNVGPVLGLITLEDVVESLLGEPIDDEDEYDHNMAGRGHNLNACANIKQRQNSTRSIHDDCDELDTMRQPLL